MTATLPKPPSAFVEGPAAELIPADLRAQKRFVGWKWKYKPAEGKKAAKWDKPPIDPRTGHEIDATDPANWLGFDEARQLAIRHGDGIGIALGSKDNRLGIVGVDIDACIDAQGNIDPAAISIVDKLNSYTEYTPSGKGLRVLVWASKPGERCKHTKRKVELYESDRYLTLTGRHYPGSPTTLEQRQAELTEVYNDLFNEAAKPAENVVSSGGNSNGVHHQNGEPSPFVQRTPSELDDDALIQKARESKNGDRFSALFDRGDLSDYGGDHSAGDLAAMNTLAFWLDRDANRMERAFSQSALGQREKWKDRPDYRKWTIDKAIAGCTDVYDPPVVLKIGGKAANSQASGQAKDRRVNEAADDPHRLAKMFLRHHRVDGLFILRFHQGEWCEWTGAYRPVKESELSCRVNRAIKEQFDRLNKLALEHWKKEAAEAQAKGMKPKPKPEARKVTRVLVANTMQAMQGRTLLKRDIKAPCWLEGKGPFNASEIIPAKNALVHLPSVVIGELADPAKMSIKPTPRFFATYALEFDFDPGAEQPVEWLRFLRSVWGDDQNSIDTLQEWFGYCLTPDTTQEKILALIGPKRAGKDTIGRVLTGIVGSENTAGPTLASLSASFGLAPLIGKPLAIVSDARISGRTDSAVIVERLLAISGRGRLTVDRKFIDSWEGMLPTRFVLISNELPRLTDSSGALASRLVILRLSKSFYGQEDMGLYERLKAELPGILLWAIEGWRRLRARGYFVQPKSGHELMESLEELSSPVLAFVRQRCNIGPGQEVRTADLFREWSQWCQENGRKESGTQQSFARDLRAACAGVTAYKTTRGDEQLRMYKGIDIKVSF